METFLWHLVYIGAFAIGWIAAELSYDIWGR